MNPLISFGRRFHTARFWACVVLAAMSLLRVLWAVSTDCPLANDGIINLGLAKIIHQGGGWVRMGGETFFSPGLPMAIALCQCLGLPEEAAGRLIVAAASTLLPLLLLLVYSRFVPFVHAWGIGALWVLFPLPFSLAQGIWTEPLFYGVVLLMLVGLFRPATTGRAAAGWAGWRGFWGGVAYYVKPEGLLMFAAGEVLEVVANRKMPRQACASAGLALGLLVIVASPYWIHLHAATGRWTLSSKTTETFSLAARMSQGDEGTSSVDADGVPAGGWGSPGAHLFRYGKRMKTSLDALAGVWTMAGVVLAGAGLVMVVGQGNWALLAFGGVLCLPLLAYPLLPFWENRFLSGTSLGLLPLIVTGSLAFWQGTDTVARALGRGVVVLLVALMMLAWVPGFRDTVTCRYNRGIVRREIGRRLQPRLEGRTLMSISLQTAYYGHAAWVSYPPGKSLGELIAYADSNGVDFVEISTYDKDMFDPSVLALANGTVASARWRLMGREQSAFGEDFSIFEVLPP